MIYQILITSSAKKSVKRLERNIKKEILVKIQKLKENPYLGEKLSGSLHFLYSLHFKIKNVDYLAAYTVDSLKKSIIVHLIGTRENFYKKLKKTLR